MILLLIKFLYFVFVTSVEMASSTVQQQKNARKLIQQVVKAKFVKAYNAIELIYGNDGGRGCKGIHHVLNHFPKLYIVPCKKSLDCPYFQEIFLNNSTDIDLDILSKQQYYVSFCHKLCEECLNYPNDVKCPSCESNQRMDFGILTKWMFNLPILQGCKIQCLKEFHDVYGQYDKYLENYGDCMSSKTRLKPSP